MTTRSLYCYVFIAERVKRHIAYASHRICLNSDNITAIYSLHAVKARLHDTCKTGLTTGCIVYTNIELVVKAVSQPAVSLSVQAAAVVLRTYGCGQTDRQTQTHTHTDSHTDARDHNTFCVVYDSYKM